MKKVLQTLWSDQHGQDIAEYAVMLAVILVIVVGTIRLVGSNANKVFSSVRVQFSKKHMANSSWEKLHDDTVVFCTVLFAVGYLCSKEGRGSCSSAFPSSRKPASTSTAALLKNRSPLQGGHRSRKMRLRPCRPQPSCSRSLASQVCS